MIVRRILIDCRKYVQQLYSDMYDNLTRDIYDNVIRDEKQKNMGLMYPYLYVPLAYLVGTFRLKRTYPLLVL